jgi:hypothetical protein
MDNIKNIILKVEDLKIDQKYEKCIPILTEALIKYSEDYRLYEELADVYLYM